jgi:hypothetical protein
MARHLKIFGLLYGIHHHKRLTEILTDEVLYNAFTRHKLPALFKSAGTGFEAQKEKSTL